MNYQELISFEHLLQADRSVRRFKSDVEIPRELLERLVGLTRYCASGRNLQPLRYRIVDCPKEKDAIFPLLKWAGYYTEWDGPELSQRPAAYIVQCLDTNLTENCLCDDGLNLQAITLGATALGLGACIIKAFNAPALAEVLDLPEQLKPLYVLALGVPAEETKIVPMTDGDYKYFRDEADAQCVPKRSLEELIIK